MEELNKIINAAYNTLSPVNAVLHVEVLPTLEKADVLSALNTHLTGTCRSNFIQVSQNSPYFFCVENTGKSVLKSIMDDFNKTGRETFSTEKDVVTYYLSRPL